MAREKNEKDSWTQTTVILYPGDRELLKYVSERMQMSMAETIRTAIRAYASHIERTLGPIPPVV